MIEVPLDLIIDFSKYFYVVRKIQLLFLAFADHV